MLTYAAHCYTKVLASCRLLRSLDLCGAACLVYKYTHEYIYMIIYASIEVELPAC
jgi:hypothetical protein